MSLFISERASLTSLTKPDHHTLWGIRYSGRAQPDEEVLLEDARSRDSQAAWAGLKGSSNLDDSIAVARYQRIMRHQAHRLDKRLGNQDAIKWVLVMRRQILN